MELGVYFIHPTRSVCQAFALAHLHDDSRGRVGLLFEYTAR